MWNYQKNILVCMIAGLGLSTCTPSDVSIPGAATIDVMNGFPDGESGYALGVSGCYAGKLGDFLLMAGGCNFPDKPVSEGGIKHYYKGIYIARVDDSSSLRWVKAGELPMEAAYGATVSLPDRLIFIGGSNSSDRFSSVLSFSFDCMKDSGVRLCLRFLMRLIICRQPYWAIHCMSWVGIGTGFLPVPCSLFAWTIILQDGQRFLFPGGHVCSLCVPLCLANCMFSVDLPPEGMRLFQQMDYVTILNLDNGRWLRHLSPQKVNLSH